MTPRKPKIERKIIDDDGITRHVEIYQDGELVCEAHEPVELVNEDGSPSDLQEAIDAEHRR